MSQIANLSAESRNIVENYLSGNIFLESNKKQQLIVTLYAMFDDAKPKVLDILKSYIVNLNESLPEKDILVLKKESKAVIIYCHTRNETDFGIVSSPTSNKPNLMIPESLLELCENIIVPNEDSDIFLPYSATAQFAFSKSDCKFEGFEDDSEIWAFSQIYLQCYGINADISLTTNMFDALPEGKQYDTIFSFPPIMRGMEGKAVIDNLHYLATNSLKENGTMCCILPLSFCSVSNDWLELRKILLDYKGQFSAAVISLPKMLYPITYIDICVFILQKDKQGKVLLMDASSDIFCARQDILGDKEYVLKVQSVIETITKSDERYVWKGLISDLVGNFNLLPSRYLIPQILPKPSKNEHSVRLDEVIEIIPLQQDEKIRSIIEQRNRLAHSPSMDITPKEADNIMFQYRELEKRTYPIIRIKNLSSSYLNCDIRRDVLPANPKMEYRVLTTDCLLIGFIGGKFKVGRLHGVSPTSPATLSPEIVPIRVVSDNITEDFFLRCMMSESVQRQAKMMTVGNTIFRIAKHDLLSIIINVPNSKEEQERIFKVDTRSSLSDADKKLIESAEEFRRDMHMKKHAIGQTIFNINNWWNLLKLAREKGSGIVDDNAELGTNRKVKVADIYSNLEFAISKLSTQLSKFDTGYGLKAKDIDLCFFIDKYISEHKNPLFKFINNSQAFHLEDDMQENDFEEFYTFSESSKDCIHQNSNKKYVNFPPEALTIIFDNIIHNACSHGFIGRESANNLICIDIVTEGTDYVVTISNNGNPMADLTQEDVFTYSLSTGNMKEHFGIGGYEIKKLMNEFQGDVQIISKPNEQFTVTYKLIFHETK